MDSDLFLLELGGCCSRKNDGFAFFRGDADGRRANACDFTMSYYLVGGAFGFFVMWFCRYRGCGAGFSGCCHAMGRTRA